MAQIILGSLTTIDTSVHLDPMFTELYQVRNLLTVSGSNLGLGVTPSAKWHAKDSNPEVGRFETSNSTGGYISGYTTGGALRGFMGWGTNVFPSDAFGLRSASSIPISIAMGGATPQLKIDTSGNVVTALQSGAPTLATNLDMAFQLVSNTSLKILVRGSDGTTRSTTLTLS